MVIAKLVNRRDALALLRNKKKLSELSPDGKKKLKTNKVYINESFCPSYKRILCKCNALLKKGSRKSAPGKNAPGKIPPGKVPPGKF